jgi:diadenosine tetraphosphate (Ap4A) HIT family hydrolase
MFALPGWSCFQLPGARELEDVPPDRRAQLMDEIVLAGRAVRAVGEALGRPVFKLNVGALGNIAPQLHIHVIGRREDDPAWPGPVWGVDGAIAYPADDLKTALRVAREVFEVSGMVIEML